MRGLLIPLLAILAFLDWIVVDPSGKSREAVIVVDGVAYRVKTVPLKDAPLPEDPGEDPPDNPPPGEPVPDKFGFVTAARGAAGTLPQGERQALARLYRQANSLPAGDVAELTTKVTSLLKSSGIDLSIVGPVVEAVNTRIAFLWGTTLNSIEDIRQAYLETAYGLEVPN